MSVVTHAQGFPTAGAAGTGVGGSIYSSGTVSVSGTPLQLVPSPLQPAVVGVIVQARVSNTSGVFIGNASMNSAGDGGVELRPGGTIFYPIGSPVVLYAVSQSGTQSVIVQWV